MNCMDCTAGLLLTTVHRFKRLTTRLLTTTMLLTLTTALAAPSCEYSDIPTNLTGYGDWPYTLVDTALMLPADYEPDDLVPLSQAGFNDDRLIRAVAIDQLAAMRQAADDAGNPIEVQSAYRSYSYQEQTFAYWVELEGREAALSSSARPGHSEHQLGTALDFRSLGGAAPWDLEDWADTAAGAWMLENAWKFGFVLSYPKDSRDVTCYIYEPWHYRYVGVDVARLIHETGLTPREWLWAYNGLSE